MQYLASVVMWFCLELKVPVTLKSPLLVLLRLAGDQRHLKTPHKSYW